MADRHRALERTLVVSDLHLGASDPGADLTAVGALPALLDAFADRPTRLIINGDGLDFLLDPQPLARLEPQRACRQARAIVARHRPVFDALRRMLGRGGEVVFVLGNHDPELALPDVQAVLVDAAGPVAFRAAGPQLIELGGARILVTHGEHVDPAHRWARHTLPGADVGVSGRHFRHPIGSHRVKRAVERLRPSDPALAARLEPVVTAAAPRAGDARALGLAPLAGEWDEARRLQAIFRAGAVIMGHTHIARFGAEGDMVYVNTGAWIPSMSLPLGPSDDASAWLRWLDADPAMPDAPSMTPRTGVMRATAALIEATPGGASVALVRWVDGGLEVMDRDGRPCIAEVPRVPRRPRLGAAGRAIRPLMVGADGRRFAPGGFDADRGPAAPSRRLAVAGDGDTVLASPTGDKHDLALQRWGLVVRADERDRIQRLLAPLIAQRRAETGADIPLLEWPAPGGHDAPDPEGWVCRTWLGSSLERLRPAYLLIVGDLGDIPRAVEQCLVAAGAFVGRLAFTDDADYTRYAEKVVRWQSRASAVGSPELAVFAALDGSEAMAVAQVGLVDPLVEALREEDAFPTVVSLDARCWSGTADDLLGDPMLMGPNLLFSVGHGIGPPAGGWLDAEARRREQGALKLGGGVLDADALRRGRFLPGGIWFSLACFSAGTPAESDFAHWLDTLDGSPDPDARAVLSSLSPEPFVARAAMAALANPNGPLAVVGHVDLAWTHAFDHPLYRGQKPHQRFIDFVCELGRREGQPGRVGVAAWRLWSTAWHFESAIARSIDRARRRGEPPPPAGAHWLARHDLASYAVLGDPAVTLAGAAPLRARDGVGASVAVGPGLDPHLPPMDVERVIHLAIHLDLVAPESRPLLMEGIDRRVWRGIPTAPDPIGQLRHDLRTLNHHPAPALLARWLTNASGLIPSRTEAPELRAFAARLGALDPAGVPRQDP